MGITRFWGSNIPMLYDVTMATAGHAPGVDSCMDAQLQVAMNLWIAKETQPAKDSCDALRAALNTYEKAAMEDAKQRAQSRVLAALGEPPKDVASQGDPASWPCRLSLSLIGAKEDLLNALEALQDILAPEEAPVALVPSPEPAKPWYDEALLREAQAFLQEIDQTDYDNMHHMRLTHVLQIHVAQCRRLMEQIPVSHTMHQVLGQTMRRLGGIRGTTNLDVFIKGLARHHKDDWNRVISRAREALTKYDTDVDTSLTTPPPTSRKNDKSSPNRDSQPVVLPKLLKAQADGRKVTLFGGLVIHEKVQAIKDRTGLDVEWFEVEEGSPRGSSSGISRVRKEKMSCVIILEGLISHGVWRSMVDSCDAEDVVYVMGGRAGIGTIVQCLETVEAKL